jgi:phosphopentomutase
MKIERVVLIVLDGVGAGASPDAAQFGDEGSHSLAHAAEAVGGLRVPNLRALGLGNITPIAGVAPVKDPAGAYGKMAEISQGKDTTIGHWELAGVYSPEPLPVFPHGFPTALVAEYERRIGRKIIGNYPSSGTEIIQILGAEHIRTGAPIVYTSGDSVFQVAAHEAVIPIPELYRICEIARELLTGEWAVGRVIARPFVGEAGHFTRTERRKDWSLVPPRPTILDQLSEAGYAVVTVGKLDDIFARRGITRSAHVVRNDETVARTIEFLKEEFRGLLFANLIEFDMMYGHRNDAPGYARALEAFDAQLPAILAAMGPQTVLMVTSDHGNDPAGPSTDHSREYAPLLVAGEQVVPGDLGVRATFADVAATLADLFGVKPPEVGQSFRSLILRD